MTESKKRKSHPPEFKAKVGLEALGGMKTINQIAQEYGVHPVQVGQWKREIQAQAKSLFEGNCRAIQAEQGARGHIDPSRMVPNETLAGPATPTEVDALWGQRDRWKLPDDLRALVPGDYRLPTSYTKQKSPLSF